MEPTMPLPIHHAVGESGIIAVLVIDNPEKAVPLARTLIDNGISSMELTLRTETALESLRRIREEVPEMLAGVGTILAPDQVDAAQDADAAFGVAPGFHPAVVDRAREKGLPYAPGISTPSEIEAAVEKGCRVLKYFHAEGMGGTRYLRGVNAPYGFLNLKYIPLGGLNISNSRGYLEMPEILAIGGSWIAPREAIAAGDWDSIGRNAAEAARVAREVRG